MSFIHPCDISTGLFDTLLFEIDNQAMTIKELRAKLKKYSPDKKIMSVLPDINQNKNTDQ